MEFKFAKYTEVTDFALVNNPEYACSGYTRFFICPDVWDAHCIRVLPGFNRDYEKDENCILVEYEKFDNDHKGQSMTPQRLKRLVEDDGMENWDYHIMYSMEEVIDSLNDGFGILNLKETVTE